MPIDIAKHEQFVVLQKLIELQTATVPVQPPAEDHAVVDSAFSSEANTVPLHFREGISSAELTLMMLFMQDLLQDFHLRSPRDEREAETLQQALKKFRDSLALHLEGLKPTV